MVNAFGHNLHCEERKFREIIVQQTSCKVLTSGLSIPGDIIWLEDMIRCPRGAVETRLHERGGNGIEEYV